VDARHPEERLAARAHAFRDIEQGEREKIEATGQGSRARIQAISAALREAESLQLQDTEYYRQLEQERVNTTRQMLDEEGKLRAEAGKEAAANDEKMGALMVAADREAQQLLNSSRRTTAQQRIAQETQLANEEYAIQQIALAKEIAALDTGGKDYENKLKALQDKEKQFVQQHENEKTAIKEKAETERNAQILSAEHQATSAIAAGLTQSIMGHKTWASMIDSLGEQAAEGMIRNALMIAMQQDKVKLSNAKAAASSAYATGESMGPAGIVLGPVFAAAAFAGVMAFHDGTDSVPGWGTIGIGDRVPAMLEPGEGVVPGGVMAGLRDLVRNGGLQAGTTVHVHYRPTNHVHAIDSDGVRRMLDEHGREFQKHIEGHLRKMNR
jgi:hypothetical protein